ncbi:Csu type fimbrial protein [Bartonella sp. LJL80]
MRCSFYGRSLLAGACLILAGNAFAASPVTDTFDVKLTIENGCDLQSVDGIDFGTHAVVTDSISGEGKITVACTDKTAYKLKLDKGQNGTDVSTRKMLNGTSTLNYNLYTAADGQSVWGDTEANWKTGVGNGQNQDYSVYGIVAGSQPVVAGVYSDAVTVTLEY